MSNAFAVTTANGKGRAVVVRVRGRLDAKTAPQLMERCQEVRTAGTHLIVNLAEVPFLSSSGIGALMVLAEKSASDGGSLRLASVSAAVRSALQLLNLDRFLTIDGSEDEALAALEA